LSATIHHLVTVIVGLADIFIVTMLVTAIGMAIGGPMAPSSPCSSGIAIMLAITPWAVRPPWTWEAPLPPPGRARYHNSNNSRRNQGDSV